MKDKYGVSLDDNFEGLKKFSRTNGERYHRRDGRDIKGRKSRDSARQRRREMRRLKNDQDY